MEKDVRITITGDFCPINKAEEHALSGSYSSVFNGFEEIFKGSDLNITNLECPLTEHDKEIKKVGPCLKSAPQAIELLKYSGVNLVTLANNHIMDFGRKGFEDTLKLLKQNEIETVGGGLTEEEASTTFYFSHEGMEIAIINCCEEEFSIANENIAGANIYDTINCYYRIKEAKKQADFVIVIIHGGTEHYNLPSPRIVKEYRFLAEAGASAIISHHAHCISGYEVYKETPIFYGLGNLIFDYGPGRPDSWHKGIAIQLVVSKEQKIDFEIIPYNQDRGEKMLSVLHGKAKNEVLEEVSELSTIISDAKLLKKHWNKQVVLQENKYLNSIHGYGRIIRKLKKVLNRPALLYKERFLLRMYDYILCHSHYDIVKDVLRKKIYDINRTEY